MAAAEWRSKSLSDQKITHCFLLNDSVSTHGHEEAGSFLVSIAARANQGDGVPLQMPMSIGNAPSEGRVTPIQSPFRLEFLHHQRWALFMPAICLSSLC